MFALHRSKNLSTVALQNDWIVPAIERSSDPNCPEQLKWTDPGLDALVNVIWPKARKKNESNYSSYNHCVTREHKSYEENFMGEKYIKLYIFS